jgi:hypothetical protein
MNPGYKKWRGDIVSKGGTYEVLVEAESDIRRKIPEVFIARSKKIYRSRFEALQGFHDGVQEELARDCGVWLERQ